MIKYSMTNNSVTVIHNGKSHTVRKGASNYLALRKAVTEKRWLDVPQYLTVAKSIKVWAKGHFSVENGSVKYDGKFLPAELNARITAMVASGDSPEPFFKFWERLQKNPSYQSVNQLWPFLQHTGIPLTDDGCFLAYKGVKTNYKDLYSGKFDNSPGAVHKMPRNQISDDPNVDCDVGFHVGSESYARTFGPKTIVVKVAPENVVSVPLDKNCRKMRVCEYAVIGNYGDRLSSTVISTAEIPTYNDDDDDNQKDFLDEPLDIGERQKVEKATERRESARKPLQKHRFNTMNIENLLKQSIGDLRHYATHVCKIVGASHIPGGRVTLIAKILETRSKAG